MVSGCKITLVVILLVALCIPLSGKALAKVHQMTDGEIAALQLTLFAEIYWRATTDLDAPIMAVYDGKCIQMTVFGGRDNAEGAKETILNYIIALKADYFPYLEEYFDIELSMDDFKIIYRNRKVKKIKTILIYENGEYKIP